MRLFEENRLTNDGTEKYYEISKIMLDIYKKGIKENCSNYELEKIMHKAVDNIRVHYSLDACANQIENTPS